MVHDTIQDLLIAHADGLNEGVDYAPEFLLQHESRQTELDTLFAIAYALKRALRPRLAPAEVASLILEDMRVEADTMHWAGKIGKRRLIWVGAIASLIGGVAGFLLWWRRRGGGIGPTTAV